jgi:hypothetical protein
MLNHCPIFSIEVKRFFESFAKGLFAAISVWIRMNSQKSFFELYQVVN